MSNVKITVPWPPSVNHYLRRTGKRFFLNEKAKAYRKETMLVCRPYKNAFPKDIRIALKALAYPPDRRVRDLDNTLKFLIDSLKYAGIFEDDSQIDSINITRCSSPERRGTIDIILSEF